MANDPNTPTSSGEIDKLTKNMSALKKSADSVNSSFSDIQNVVIQLSKAMSDVLKSMSEMQNVKTFGIADASKEAVDSVGTVSLAFENLNDMSKEAFDDINLSFDGFEKQTIKTGAKVHKTLKEGLKDVTTLKGAYLAFGKYLKEKLNPTLVGGLVGALSAQQQRRSAGDGGRGRRRLEC